MYTKSITSKIYNTVAKIILLAVLIALLIVLTLYPLQAQEQQTQEPEVPQEQEQPMHGIQLTAMSCLILDPLTPDPLDGYVDFTARSWSGNPLNGENPSVLVQYQLETDTGFVTDYRSFMYGKFTKENKFRFSGTLYVGGNTKRVTLLVTALGEWSDHTQGGQMTDVDLYLYACDGTTSLPVEGEPVKVIKIYLSSIHAN